MADQWVINASPIILLGKAGIIQFLPSLCDELVIPAGVAAEIEVGSAADAGRRWLAGDGQKWIRPTPNVHSALVNWRGGAGEAEVISWALHNPGFVAILDDRRARGFARQHRVAVLGSLRIIVVAKERGLIREARPALETLRGAGAYVTDELIDRAIALAGEQKA